MAGRYIVVDGKLVDSETGENFGLGILPIRKPKLGSNFWMMALHAGELLATNEDISGFDLRVLLFMTSRLEYDNIIRVTQTLIASRMKVSRQAVNGAVGRLVKAGLLEKVDRGTYRLDPYLGYRGKTPNHRKALKQSGLAVIQGEKRSK